MRGDLPDQGRCAGPRDQLGVDGVVDVDFDGTQMGRFDQPAGRQIDSSYNYCSALVVIAKNDEVGCERQDGGEKHEEVGSRDARERVAPADPTWTHRSSLAHLFTNHPASLLPHTPKQLAATLRSPLLRRSRTRKK